MTCKRNAFIMLCNTSQERAVEYLNDVFPQVPTFDELLQLAVIELIRKDSKTNPANKAAYIRCIFELVNVPSHSVKYEAATTLMTLTHNPAAVKGNAERVLFFSTRTNFYLYLLINVAVASCYIELSIKESDNNVKLIVLDRFEDLRAKHGRVLDDMVMEILRVLSR